MKTVTEHSFSPSTAAVKISILQSVQFRLLTSCMNTCHAMHTGAEDNKNLNH